MKKATALFSTTQGSVKTILALLLLGISIGAIAEETPKDLRPKFDKRAYCGTLWTHVNPWWKPNKPRTGCPLGGPNYARKLYPQNNALGYRANSVGYWKEAMRECQAKGMTGWQFELVVHTPGYADTLKEAVQAAEELGDFKLQIFVDLIRDACGGSVEGAIQKLFEQFDLIAEEYKHSEAFFRIDGAPILAVYTSYDFSPDEWLQIQSAFESRYGKAIWLANYWWKTYSADTKQEELRAYMPVFDGCTAYADWADQDEIDRRISEVMHNEFPHKIYEAAVHNSWSVHYTHVGVNPHASRKYRTSWESIRKAKPDAVTMTNLFDHWENSLILPCYEREDFLLRYGELMMSQLYGKPFAMRKQPEVVVTSYIDMVAGWRDLLFEVITFPIDDSEKVYSYELELLDESGQVVHAFPKKTIKLDIVHTNVFTIPSSSFVGRLLIPRLRGFWRDEPCAPLTLPPVWVDPALRNSMMFWARSTANALHSKDGSHDWTLNGMHPGEVVDWNATQGRGLLAANLEPEEGQTVTCVRVMRNGEEFTSFRHGDLKVHLQTTLPCPLLNDDYYWLEMECADGNRFESLPIWVSARKDNAHTFLPDMNGSFMAVTLPAGRFPTFYYPCSHDAGQKLVDIGGLQHNGRFNMEQPAEPFGALERTGYRHFVDDMNFVAVPNLFQTDSDGRGFMHLGESKGFFMMAGSSSFSYSCTYEISLRPAAIGHRMGILGTANGNLNLFLDEAGHVVAQRNMAANCNAAIDIDKGNEIETEAETVNVSIVSKEPLKAGEWAKVAVVYDCRTLYLYLNGMLQGTATGFPVASHAVVNFLCIGCSLHFLQEPYDFFNGDFRDVRLSGRPLLMEELL